MAKHNIRYCSSVNPLCPCLGCKHDNRVDNVNTDTKCCDLVGHRTSCRSKSRCPDFEPESKRVQPKKVLESGAKALRA